MTDTRIDFTWVNIKGWEIGTPYGYNVADYFRGGWTVLEEAETLPAEAAQRLLDAAYKGPDDRGIGLTWTLEEETAQ